MLAILYALTKMEKNKIIKYIGITALVIIAFLFGVSIRDSARKEKSNDVEATIKSEVDLIIYYSNEKVETYSHLSLPSYSSVFDLLKEAEKDGLNFEYQDYGGALGVFIKSINNTGPDPDGKKWWQYWINNEYAKMGVSSQKVSAGDIIEFKYTDDQQ